MKKLVLLLALLALAGCSAGYDQYKSAYMKPRPEERFDFEGNTVRYSTSAMVFEASNLTPGLREVYFREFRGGAFKDPFPPGSTVLFLVTIKNRGKEALTYNPGMTSLYPKQGDPVTALDYTSFYTLLNYAGAPDFDTRMRAFKESAFSEQINIRPGETVQRLVAFLFKPGASDKAVLVMEDIFSGGEEFTVPFYFERMD